VPLPGVKGGTHGVVITLDHLGELEQNLRRLDRLANLGMLSASVAHEIKNALVAVKTFVDLLLEKNREAELTGVVGREMKRIDALVTQMLRMASPARPSFAPVSVHEVLDHSLQLVQHQLDEKLIQLQRSFLATPHQTHGNSYLLEQAFINVLLNAVEAMTPNGQLVVNTTLQPATKNSPARICIVFQDSGVGIPPENMGRLFETFFTTKRNGTGLGLAITRSVVQEHGGDITAESQPNHGATFRITLPLAAAGGAIAQAVPA
jgi:signal transduction histidine kinase